MYTLVSLIDVLAWISILGGKFLKSNKRPALNKCPGTKFSSEFSVVATYYLTFFTYFDVSLPQWNSCWEICEKLIIVLPLIRVSWEENWRKIIRMYWTTWVENFWINIWGYNFCQSLTLLLSQQNTKVSFKHISFYAEVSLTL